ncbi:hypothetical protein OQJ05_09055 [Fluoribacter gormanii]|uniref:hypothetical protein n=1 Tax=Fluoribacter gormanii TaxID=464 RepID=UPI002244B830|nr:hypothetical protein [Fluoribacter gormanii]MCW8444195.1 hypothetical protein [Fluoribacter gormanii]
MSGPKVVRVVSKEERRADCYNRLESVKDSYNEWYKFATKNDVSVINETKEIENQILHIDNLINRDKFEEAKQKCAETFAQTKQDISRIRDELIAKAEFERSIRVRLKYTAEMLIGMFEKINCSIPNELPKIVFSVLNADESDLSIYKAFLDKIITNHLTEAADKNDLTSDQRELATQLLEGESNQNFADWKLMHAKETIPANSKRLNKLLAELSVLDETPNTQAFLKRANLIELESSPSHRSLLTDSIILDLLAYIEKQKEKHQLTTLMRKTRCELIKLTSKSAKNLIVSFDRAIESNDISSYESLNDQATKLINEESKLVAAVSRRDAILKGLSDLGYEVNENMETAWAKNGRIILKKSDENGYGIELGAASDAERVQIQLVSFEQTQNYLNSSKNLEKEKEWCNEFSHLKISLEQSGTMIDIERALPIGAKALKVVQKPYQKSSAAKTTKAQPINKERI